MCIKESLKKIIAQSLSFGTHMFTVQLMTKGHENEFHFMASLKSTSAFRIGGAKILEIESLPGNIDLGLFLL